MAKPHSALSKARALDQYVKVEREINKLAATMEQLVERREQLQAILVGPEATTPYKRNKANLTTKGFLKLKGGRATIDQITRYFGCTKPQAYGRLKGIATVTNLTAVLKEAA